MRPGRAVAAAAVLALVACGGDPTPAEAAAAEVCGAIDTAFSERDTEGLALLAAGEAVHDGYQDAPDSVGEDEYVAALQATCPDLIGKMDRLRGELTDD